MSKIEIPEELKEYLEVVYIRNGFFDYKKGILIKYTGNNDICVGDKAYFFVAEDFETFYDTVLKRKKTIEDGTFDSERWGDNVDSLKKYLERIYNIDKDIISCGSTFNLKNNLTYALKELEIYNKHSTYKFFYKESDYKHEDFYLFEYKMFCAENPISYKLKKDVIFYSNKKIEVGNIESIEADYENKTWMYEIKTKNGINKIEQDKIINYE